MAIYKDDPEYGKLRMVHAVVDMLEIYGPGQRSVKIGLLGMDVANDLGYPGEEDIENSVLVDCHGNFRGFPGIPDEINRQLMGEGRRYCNGMLQRQPPMCHLTAPMNRDLPKPPPVTKLKPPIIVRTPPVVPYESPAERRARLLEEERKNQEKAEKKRVKKQKQKERRRLDRLEKEKQNPERSVEVKDDSQRSKAEESKRVNDTSSKNNSSSSESTLPGKQDASRYTDSSDSSDEYYSEEEEGSEEDSESTDSEELDLTSTFVSKAATIAARQLEQAKSERREKKKNPVKKETQSPEDETNEEEDDDKKESTATPSNPSVDDFKKISTEMALLGNNFASTGQFDVAVKYFTDAIKYNPREFRLFGNRAFCFEKMQEYEKSLTDAELSLNMCPGWVKGLFRKGRALAGLQRYDEAAQAFKEVLKLDSSCTDAAQELMRVQISQLMAYGFSREQSSNALIIHGTMDKALEVLSKLNGKAGVVYRGGHPGPLLRHPVENMAPVSHFPAAAPKHYPPPQIHSAPRPPLQSRPKGPVQNMFHVQSHPKPYREPAMKTNAESPDPQQELFPIWVGNLVQTVTEAMITDLFSKVGEIHSVKVLYARRCAFINYTNQDHCDEAILQFHGHELQGIRITVRYPDRIPKGLGMSKAALKAADLPDDNPNQKECFFWRNMGCTRRPTCPFRHILEHKGIDHRGKPRHNAPGTQMSQE